MTDKDKDSTSQENPAETGEDLENLSLDEKAAFEKIMAEINSADQGSQGQGANANPEATAPTETDRLQPGTQPDHENTKGAAGEIKAQNQQAENSDETLSDDQQAALDKMMAEINAKGTDAEPETAETEKPPADNNEELSDDQQAALDKIMAEINARGTDAEPETAETEKPPADNNEELSDDQQAALDKIMAEINAKGTDAEPETAETEIPPADGDQKSSDEEDTRITPEKNTENLSIDEFNDELNNLLSNAQLNAQSQPLRASGASNPDSTSEISSDSPPEPPDMAPSEKAVSDSEESSAEASHKESHYPILQEISDSEGITAAPDSKTASLAHQGHPGRTRRIKITALVGLVVIVVIGAGLWHYKTAIQNKVRPSAPQQQADAEPHPLTAPIAANRAEGPTDPANHPISDRGPALPAATPSRPLAPTSFGTLKSDLIAARHQVNQKVQEIIKLKAYYQKGIHNEQEKIWAELKDKPMPSLAKAIADNAIALSIRAIQRRMVYIDKLDAPLRQLQDSAEDLLYLERKTEFFETLSQWISGPSLPEYKQEIANRIQDNLKVGSELSVDRVQVETPSETTVWNEIVASFKAKKPVHNTRPANKALDEQIGREICDGNYSRKYLLTSLSRETAQCLVQWSGKDLYLNELTALTPQLAKILVQWPGEWLSLNGLKEISPETAKYLSQWPGKHLSLNGLEKLSPQVTAQLSQWRGAQLEMVGLTAIGRWENYSTRLFLSEALRQKLQM